MSKVTGFSEFAAKLNKMSANVQQDVREITEYHLSEITLEAIRQAPGPGELVATEFGTENERDIVRDRGWTPISQAITFAMDVQSKGFKGHVQVDASAGAIAIWVEMGTGQSAKSYLMTVPAEWRALARKYYLNGKGTIIAQPYLLPAFMKHKVLYIQDLKKALKNVKL